MYDFVLKNQLHTDFTIEKATPYYVKVKVTSHRAIRFIQRMLFAKSYGFFRSFRDMPLLKWKVYKYLGIIFNRKKLIEKLYTLMSRGNSGKYAIYCHYNGGLESARYYDKKDFSKTFTMCFEGGAMPVPKGWASILISSYGEDYNERQGFFEEKKRHGFYDVNVPYEVYKKRFSGLHYPSLIHEPIVLFGDGKIFKSCLSYYKSRVNITHLVQLPGEKPMDPVMGMDVETWDEFMSMNIPRGDYRAIICSGDTREAEKIMQNNEYTEYYIFWYEREWMLYANQTAIWKAIGEL